MTPPKTEKASCFAETPQRFQVTRPASEQHHLWNPDGHNKDATSMTEQQDDSNVRI
jgi:hypothetical protein